MAQLKSVAQVQLCDEAYVKALTSLVHADGGESVADSLARAERHLQQRRALLAAAAYRATIDNAKFGILNRVPAKGTDDNPSEKTQPDYTALRLQALKERFNVSP